MPPWLASGKMLSFALGQGAEREREAEAGPTTRSLIANGDADVMVPTPNSIAMFGAFPNAKLSIFPDASHGGIFQYADAFVDQTLGFLAE